MTARLTVLLFVAIFMCPLVASAWTAQDSISGIIIEVIWPLSPDEVARDGNHEIQYQIGDDPSIRLGEVTDWLSKCHGHYCPNDTTKTFELNTFSNFGLMYCFPIGSSN